MQVILGDKITGLSIDYNDNYMIQLTHSNGNKGCLIVDVVLKGKKPIYGFEKDKIILDLIDRIEE